MNPRISAIAERLARAAVRHRGLVNWVGRTLAEVDQGAPTHAALEPGLYDGSAGVALFLGEYAAHQGDPAAAELALGAIARSLRFAPARGSLFNGRAGIGLVAWRLGRLLGEPRLAQRGARMVREAPTPETLELLDGAAGVALAQLCVGEPEAATHTLRSTFARAHREGDRAWWDNEALCGGGVGPLPLVGLSHGQSGPAAALLALADATGRDDARELALGAVREESRWFLADSWPDLRGQPASIAAAEAPRRMAAWCHGAAGIALARALAVRACPTLATELEAAARASARAAARTRDATLCHGLGGMSEALLAAATLDPAWRDRARALWRRTPPESGLPSGAANPALLVGLAGTGHALLRLDGLAAPILLPDPAAWR